ncbi:MAG: MBL fold metallo-hydrolase [Oscillospiraceae bacterium]|jgi:beta-lactamase superfamily II metal-dependent hydrolase|nr:MBL fold metallo-hydrolase [Oscillospiraceae bacterium]
MARKRKKTTRKKAAAFVTAYILLAVVIISAAVSILPRWGLPGWNNIYRATGLVGNVTQGGEVHFIDVGQGDSVLLSDADEFILIDGGPKASQTQLLDYLRGRGITRFEAVFATHLHEDHIGGLALVLSEFPSKSVYIHDGGGGSEKDTKAVTNLLAAIASQGLSCSPPKPGEDLTLNRFELRILAPPANDESNENNNSTVIKAQYGKIAFMLTGDAEKESETAILNSSADLSATVLKLGHHGSKTSTTEAFLKAVAPLYAIACCGKSNSYGHPHSEVCARVERAGAELLRTDMNGTVVFYTDGEHLDVKTAA